MQPTCKHVPPRNGSFSTTIGFSPSSPARMAATYPPGPLPIIATSYFATLNLPSVGAHSWVRNLSLRSPRARFGLRSRTSVLSPAHFGGCRPRHFYPCLNGDSPTNLEFYQPQCAGANQLLSWQETRADHPAGPLLFL